MLNTLLFIHLVIAFLLITVILLQKTNTDGLSGIGGGNNMGIVSGRSAANFLTKTTIVLAALFFINALILANLSITRHTDISALEVPKNHGQPNTVQDNNVLPIAK